MEQKNTKGHGYLRKSKAYGLISGLALGAVAVTTTAVSADETTATIDTQPEVTVVSDSNATNLSDAQADNSAAHDNLVSQAGTQTGNLTEQITSPDLNQAVSDAQNAGVTVNQGQTVTHDSLADAQADLNSQTQTVTDATTAQTTIDSTQDQAIKDAQAAGVTVTQSEGKTYTDPKEALKDNANQTAHLSEVTNAQKEATQTIADLTKQATASGLDLIKEGTKTYTSVEDVNADLAKQTETIQKAKDTKASAEATNKANEEAARDAQNKANQAIKEAIDKAVASGTEATISGTEETTIGEAENLAKEAIEKINQTIAKNQEAKAKYEQQLAEATANTQKDGYASQVVNQSLIFTSEPNAHNTVVKSDGTVLSQDSTENVTVTLHQGESVTVTYTNLEHSTYANAKISKVVYTYAARDAVDTLVIDHDPTITVTFWAGEADKGETNSGDPATIISSRIRFDAQFFDENGKVITFTADKPAAIAFNSLNRSKAFVGDGHGESLEYLTSNIEIVPITGSAVVYENGALYSSVYNDYTSNGSRFNANPADDPDNYWDGPNQPNRWYGASLGVVRSGDNIGFDIVDQVGSGAIRGYYGKFWFAFNSNVTVPVPIIPPKPLSVSVENVHITPEVVPVPKSASIHDIKLTADIHDITLSTAVHPVEVTQKPTNSKSVINSDNVDINGKTVAKGSTVKWVLQNNKLLAGREALTAVVLNDPIPAGFEVDEEETARLNSTYYMLKANEDGAYQITGTSQLLALLNKDRNQDTPVPSFTIIGKALNDKGHYANTFETIYTTASGYYKVVSNTPSYDTPDHPNPTKTVTDQSGTDINGKTSYDKDVTFHLTTDYSPYVNTIVDMATMAKAAGIYDDTDDNTVKPDITKATVTDSQGNDITATGTFYDIEAGQPIPAELQIFLDGAHLTPNGEFVVWIPNDLKDYYQNYVLTGNNVTVNLPVALIGQAGEKAENTFVQIEFSNGYSSNLVFITIPNETAEKHAVDKNGTVLDGQTVSLHQVFNYLLDGVTVTKNHDTLWQYDGKDKLDVEHDRYTGNWKGLIRGTEYTAKEDMTLPYDVTLSDGTLIKAGDIIKAGSTYAFTFEFNQDTNDDFINKIVKVTWDAQKGEWTYSIDKDFLNSLGVEGTFDVDFWLEVERIKDGEVENTFINTINGREFIAQVTTHTDPEPETPAPETPQPPAQVAMVQAAALPMTGESNSPLSILASIMGSLLVLFSFMTFRRKEKETNK